MTIDPTLIELKLGPERGSSVFEGRLHMVGIAVTHTLTVVDETDPEHSASSKDRIMSAYNH